MLQHCQLYAGNVKAVLLTTLTRVKLLLAVTHEDRQRLNLLNGAIKLHEAFVKMSIGGSGSTLIDK